MGPAKYTTWKNGDKMAGGMMQMTEEWGNIPPHWMTYIEVEDCDATVKNVQQLGGKVLHGPKDIPNTGRFAVIQDPQGAVCSVIKLTQGS
jgi:predicted enzyme related to lactoylglutathione lyase